MCNCTGSSGAKFYAISLMGREAFEFPVVTEKDREKGSYNSIELLICYFSVGVCKVKVTNDVN